jgi:predicted O-methyltransferase YrrM
VSWYGAHSLLNSFIKNNKCQRILEIGVLNGDNARTMVKAASQNVAPAYVEYYGFDFFNRSRFNEVRSKLEKTGCTFSLYTGDSTTTLPSVLHTLPKMDVIFIDGGKSYAEASSDWESSKTLMHDRTAVFVHNYEFSGVRRMVDHISREAFHVTILHPLGDAATALIKMIKR